MRLLWFLFVYLMLSTHALSAASESMLEESVYGKKLVVEKIASDAIAIETMVFESAPSNRATTSSVTTNPKHVTVLTGGTLKNNSAEGDSSQQIAQLSQRSSRRVYLKPDTISELEPKLPAVTLVKVDKSKRRMYLLTGEEVIQEFRIALGKQPKGHKRFEGDNRTPEGQYQLDYVMEESDFYRSVHINYPQPSDMQWAEQNDVDPGGNIKIHGIKNGERRSPSFIQSFDWTDGCIALTNQDMDEFIQLVKMGTPIHIEW
ncbi:L,D-transpeptidase family protein [Vibrio kanaloae]|uniref:L,D-transpeptidase family protein n=1 Tax=Vibrio kanaloae TaxID=170673 RepID=UPI003F50F46C